jgi:DNA-binding CsgD family transcriptional regulator
MASARVAASEGDGHRAEDLAHHGLTAGYQAGDKVGIADTLELLASLAADECSYHEAARLLGAGDSLRRATGYVRYAIYRDSYQATVDSIRDAIGSEAFEQAFAEGAALSLEEAVAYAARGRGERKRPSTGWASLTPAEQDVARLVAEGLANKEIADRLFISPRTVQAHLTHIYTGDARRTS